MSLGGQDLTETIAKSGAQVLRLTGFLGDDQSLHGDGRLFARASRDYRIKNITGTNFPTRLLGRGQPVRRAHLEWLPRVELSRPIEVTGMAGIGAERKLACGSPGFQFCPFADLADPLRDRLGWLILR